MERRDASVGIRAVGKRLMCPTPVARSFTAGCCDIKESVDWTREGHARRRRGGATRGATLLTGPDLPVTGEDTVLLAPLSDVLELFKAVWPRQRQIDEVLDKGMKTMKALTRGVKT